MGFSSPEVACEVCWLTRLWMFCRVDPRGLVRLSGLGSHQTHPRILQIAVICPFVVLNPTNLGATNVVAPGQIQIACLFLVKLVP
jgi:hypothetical protein